MLGFTPIKTAAQNALQFDGVDDYAEIFKTKTNTNVADGFYTVEVVFKTVVDKQEQVLMHFFDDANEVIIGLEHSFVPFVEINQTRYTSTANFFISETCAQLSVVFENAEIHLYQNGDLVDVFNHATNIPAPAPKQPIYVGRRIYDNATSFEGTMENFRIWNKPRINQEIQDFLFVDLPIHESPLYAYFNFEAMTPAVGRDPFFADNFLLLGGLQQVPNEMPIFGKGTCVQPFDGPESVSAFCQVPTTCNTAGLPPGELLCNGDFEQYCSLLDGPQPPWVHASHAFGIYFNTGFTIPTTTGIWGFGGTQAFPVSGSDVTNWNPTPIGSPDFYVRDGFGMLNNSGFNPWWNFIHIVNNTQINVNWVLNPPSNTHNGLGKAVLGLWIEENTIPPTNERVFTTLQNPLMPNTTYTFSGWFYTTNPIDYGSFLDPAKIEVGLLDLNSTDIVLANFSTAHFTSTTGNNNWHFSQVTFTTPMNLPPGLFNFWIEGQSLNNLGRYYVFIDDLSLKEVPPTVFPQYVDNGFMNDRYEKTIAVDNQDNVYTSGAYKDGVSDIIFGSAPSTLASISPVQPMNAGSYVSKYSSTGNLIWAQYYSEIKIFASKVMLDGNLLVTGETFPNPPGISTSNLQINHNAPSFTYNCNGVTTSLNGNQGRAFFFAKINQANGQIIGNIEVYGNAGHSFGSANEIIGNYAYIAIGTDNHLPCGFPIGGQVSISNLSGTATGNKIMRLNLANNILDRFQFANLSNRITALSQRNGELIVLTESQLTKLNISNLNNSFATPINLYPNSSANGLFISPQNKLYVTYADFGSNVHNRLEERNAAHPFALINFKNYLKPLGEVKAPVLVTGNANHTYLGFHYFNGNQSPQEYAFQVAKLDFSSGANFGDEVWNVSTAGVKSQPVMIWQPHTTHFFPSIRSQAFVPFNNQSKIAVTGTFQVEQGSWQFHLPPKTLAGNSPFAPHHNNNTFVAALEDLGSSSIYKMQEVSKLSEDPEELIVYPNPNKGNITIQSPFEVQLYYLYNLIGQQVAFGPVAYEKEFKLQLPQLPSGAYVLKVNGSNQEARIVITIE